jgi:hypothetical protein
MPPNSRQAPHHAPHSNDPPNTPNYPGAHPGPRLTFRLSSRPFRTWRWLTSRPADQRFCTSSIWPELASQLLLISGFGVQVPGGAPSILRVIVL